MADISIRGYVNRPKAKELGGKKVSTFSLSESYKDKKTGKKSYGFYDVIDWNHSDPPTEGSYVTVKGYMKQRMVEKDGVKRTYLDVTCTDLDVSPPKGAPAAPATTPDVEDEFSF